MDNDIIEKTEAGKTQLSINGRAYDLMINPPFNDPLVIEKKSEILNGIDLNELNDNLYLSVELLNVAYNGVAGAQGGRLQADINKLIGDLALLCNDCVGTMSVFELETKNIIYELGQTYRHLIGGKEKLAITKLMHCGKSSATMATKAEALSEAFTGLQQRSVIAKSNTVLEEAAENDKKLDAERAIRELEEKRKAEKINQEELVAQIGQVQQLYDDAKSREEKAAEKALILGITSAISGAIGAGLGAYSASKNPISNAVAKNAGKAGSKEIALAQKDIDEKKRKSDDANKKMLVVKSKLSSARNKETTLQNEIKKLKTEVEMIERVNESIRTKKQKKDITCLTKKLPDSNEKLTKTQAEIGELDAQMKDLEISAKDLTLAYGAAAAALDKLSGSMDAMASTAANAEQSIHDEKMKLLEKKFHLEDEKRKSLVEMAEFAGEISNAKIEEGNAVVTINSLHAAIVAMGKISGTLTNASLFWRQMADFCSKMSEQGFQSNLRDLIDPANGQTVEQRIEEYQSLDFMISFFNYLCQWVALNSLSGEYLSSAFIAQKKCVHNMGQSPTIEEAKRIAPELARSMGQMLDSKILNSNLKSSSILQEQARLVAGNSNFTINSIQ